MAEWLSRWKTGWEVAGLNLFPRSICSVVGSPILSFVPPRTHAPNGGKDVMQDPFLAKNS